MGALGALEVLGALGVLGGLGALEVLGALGVLEVLGAFVAPAAPVAGDCGEGEFAVDPGEGDRSHETAVATPAAPAARAAKSTSDRDGPASGRMPDTALLAAFCFITDQPNDEGVESFAI